MRSPAATGVKRLLIKWAVEKAVHTVLVGPSSRPSDLLEVRFEIVD